MLDKSSVYNDLAERMYFLGRCIFWTKVARQILIVWAFPSFSEVIQNLHVIFETRSQFLYKLCTIL